MAATKKTAKRPAPRKALGSGEPFEVVPISKLKPDPRNARRHGARNLEVLTESLRRFGVQRPIVVDRNGVVLAGNATLEAAKSLGMTELPVMRSTLAGAEALAYAIADNRAAELAEWDAGVLQELAGEVDLTPFMTDGEIAALAGSWELPPEDMKKLERQVEPDFNTAKIAVSCNAGDRIEVCEAIRAALADFGNIVVD